MVKARRCDWCGDDPLYVDYHDREWGVPVTDSDALFERLMLEGMQAGLSWYTVLKKRDHMRSRFFDFDPRLLDEHGDAALAEWLEDPGLIRHRGKLTALIGNARATLALEQSLADLVWGFVGNAPKQNHWRTLGQVPSTTVESEALSRTLKRAGFRFVGPTICYAFMQSAGLVNDHLIRCPQHAECAELAREWVL
jgi:DNA-3-methyladenine glycosylase I